MSSLHAHLERVKSRGEIVERESARAETFRQIDRLGRLDLTVDEELGYIYLTFGTPTNDYYGGHRLGDNLFAESLVCLDARTGKRVWHFQAVRHGLWDYDFPAAPILVDITVNGRRINAVAQVSKQGFVYVFDRRTGSPVWPVWTRTRRTG